MADPEACRDLFDGDAAITAMSDHDNVLAELSGIRSGHEDTLPAEAPGANDQLSPIRSSRPLTHGRLISDQAGPPYTVFLAVPGSPRLPPVLE